MVLHKEWSPFRKPDKPSNSVQRRLMSSPNFLSAQITFCGQVLSQNSLHFSSLTKQRVTSGSWLAFFLFAKRDVAIYGYKFLSNELLTSRCRFELQNSLWRLQALISETDVRVPGGVLGGVDGGHAVDDALGDDGPRLGRVHFVAPLLVAAEEAPPEARAAVGFLAGARIFVGGRLRLCGLRLRLEAELAARDGWGIVAVPFHYAFKNVNFFC